MSTQYEIDLLRSTDQSLVEKYSLYAPERICEEKVTEIISLKRKRKNLGERASQGIQTSSLQGLQCELTSKMSSNQTLPDNVILLRKNTDVAEHVDSPEHYFHGFAEENEYVAVTTSGKESNKSLYLSDEILEKSCITEQVLSPPNDDVPSTSQYSDNITCSDCKLRVGTALEIQNIEIEYQYGHNETEPSGESPSSKRDGANKDEALTCIVETMQFPFSSETATMEYQTSPNSSFKHIPAPHSSKMLTTISTGEKCIHNSLHTSPLLSMDLRIKPTSEGSIRYSEEKFYQTRRESPIPCSGVYVQSGKIHELEEPEEILSSAEKCKQTMLASPISLARDGIQTAKNLQPGKQKAIEEKSSQTMLELPFSIVSVDIQTDEMFEIEDPKIQDTTEMCSKTVIEPPISVANVGIQTYKRSTHKREEAISSEEKSNQTLVESPISIIVDIQTDRKFLFGELEVLSTEEKFNERMIESLMPLTNDIQTGEILEPEEEAFFRETHPYTVEVAHTCSQTNQNQESNESESISLIHPTFFDRMCFHTSSSKADNTLKTSSTFSQTDGGIVMHSSDGDQRAKLPCMVSDSMQVNQPAENIESSDEQLDVKIQALVTFPSKNNKVQSTRLSTTNSMHSVEKEMELNIQGGSKSKVKKKQKRKLRRNRKSNIDNLEKNDEGSKISMDLTTNQTHFPCEIDAGDFPNDSDLTVIEGETSPLKRELLSSLENQSRSWKSLYEDNEGYNDSPSRVQCDIVQDSFGIVTDVEYKEQHAVVFHEGSYASQQNVLESAHITEIVDDVASLLIRGENDSNIPCDLNVNEKLVTTKEYDKILRTNVNLTYTEEEEISFDVNKGDDTSMELTTLIENFKCDELDVCSEKEIFYNEWKQVHTLVSNQIYKLQNEKYTSCLSDVIYIATLQHRITDDTADERDTALQHSISGLNAAVDSKDKILIHKTIISTIKKVYAWLENIEYHRLLSTQLKTSTSDHIKKLNTLNNEIAIVRQKVGGLTAVMENIYCLFDNDEAVNMKRFISNLQNQVDTMVELGNEKEQQALKDLNCWEEFLNGVNNISLLVDVLKEDLDKTMEKEMLLQRKLEELDCIETTNLTLQENATQLMNNGRLLLSEFPDREIPQELYGAYETTCSIEQTAKLERERQLQLIALADEYEQTLKDFAQIVDVADALVESSILVSSLEHLQEEMQKHRKFFVNLSHCRCILESLEGNLDAETRNKHSHLHQQQHTRASGILDKAAGRAQQMALAASRWTVLEQGMKEERSWLQVAHQRVPELQSVTSSDYDQYISLFQSLSADVAVHHGHCAQLINLARSLQELVLCPGLETCYDEHMETVTKLQEDINRNLHSLLTFQDTWRNYLALTEKLCQWMNYAEKGLNTIFSENQNPGAHMKYFWELKAQYEVHEKIRNEANANFSAAMKVIPVADEFLQSQSHSSMQEKWWLVTSQIEDIQKEALKLLNNNDIPVINKLASLQEEMQELQSTMNDIKGIIKKEEELELYIQRLQVMLSCVDHIQEELSRLGLLSLDEPEKVGYLLCFAGNIELQIKEELEGSKVLYDNINTIQKGINRIKRNYDNVSSVLDQCETNITQSRDLVEQALNNCQEASEKLVSLWQDVMNLRQLLHTLPTSLHLSMSPIHLERKMSLVQDHHTVLESRAANLQNVLKNRLAMWRHFEQQLEVVQQSVQETDYMMELLTVQGSVDYDRLVKATECLEGLFGSLDQRKNLLDDLHAAVAPLTETCALEVSAKIKITVEDVEKSWNNTRQALRDLCERYQDAARLWRQYRDASDCVKTWAEQLLDSTTHLSPSEALLHVKVCEETLEAHEACLSDLRGLVAQITAHVGLNSGGPLADDIAALGRRLDSVKESLASLYEVAESQQAEDNELNTTCEFLTSVKKSLSMMEESSEKDTENKLNTLRNHLLDLGKTEGQLQTLKEKTVGSCPLKSEAKVVEILQLWQQVFKETFQHYHRLSARLVKSQDGAAALKLWKEYLLHVQSFLSTSIPQDYHGLTEHQHLCDVHRNLLTSQHSVFLAQNEESSLQNSGNAELSVLEQFNSLTNLHNETLAQMMERHNEVSVRLALWDKYSKQQACLLSWLCDVERERNRLQLHNIHIRLIPKIIKIFQAILEDKMPNGEAQIQELFLLQNSLFHDIDDSVAASVRLEFAAITQRVSNLKAALETWKAFLDRINNLIADYEQTASTVQQVCKEVNHVICESCSIVSYAEIENHLYSLQNSQIRIRQLTTNLEAMNGILEQLRECLSPIDMKVLNQRTWLLWQSHYDLDHRLAVILHQLQDRIKLESLFQSRYTRFLSWANGMELRMNESFFGDAETALACFLKEINSDISLKSREFQWLISTGQELICAVSGDDEISKAHESNIHSKVDIIHKCWEKLHNLKMAKTNKLKNIIENFSHLDYQLSELRNLCHLIESQLMKPFIINECTDQVYVKFLSEIEDLQTIIEQKSGCISEIIKISEMLSNDEELIKTTIDIKSLNIVVEAIEKRWKHISKISAERKSNFSEMWKRLKYLTSSCKEKEPWVQTQECMLEDIQEVINQCSRSDYQNCLHQIKGVLDELDLHNESCINLSQTYTIFLKNSQMSTSDVSSVTNHILNILRKWHALSINAIKLTEILCQELKLSRDFINFHGMVVMNLTELDVRLTQFQHLCLSDGESSFMEREETLRMLQKELVEINGLVHSADELGLAVLLTCSPKDQQSVEEMIDEYKQLQNDITKRLQILEMQNYGKDLETDLVTKKDESIQVETLSFEEDTAIQVNTLPILREAASLEISVCGFTKAIAECKANLAYLRNVLEEDLTDGLKLATAIAQSQSSFELVKHLSALLRYTTEDSECHRHISLITDLHHEYERLCSLACMQHQTSSESTQSEKSRLCPICSKFNWTQLDNDLWRLEQWLQFSENTQRNYQPPPYNVEELETTIQKHREFLLDFGSHENIIMSLNIVGSHLADHADNEDKAQTLRSRLENANVKWDFVGETAARRQLQLHYALMENQDFHKVIEELMERLEKVETKIRLTEPINPIEEKVLLETKYYTFKELHAELERNEPRMLSLQDAASQCPQQSDTLEKYTLSHLTRLQMRLQSLKRITKLYIHKLDSILYHDPMEFNQDEFEETLRADDNVCTSLVALSRKFLEQPAAVSPNYTERQHTDDPNEGKDNPSILSYGHQFLGRVLRVSLPVQALMLLIIGVASLLPSQEQDYSCLLTNNLAKGFEPILFYPNGPPPV